MAQSLKRQQQSAPKGGISPEEEFENEEESSFSEKFSPPVRISRISDDERMSCSGANNESLVRHWHDCIESSFALDAQAEKNDRWNVAQSIPFLFCLSAALWGLLLVGSLTFLELQ